MKAFRILRDFSSAKEIACQRGGVIKRSLRGDGWVFFPKSEHPFDALSDTEQGFVRRSTTFNERLASIEEIRNGAWGYFKDLTFAIVSGKVVIDVLGKVVESSHDVIPSVDTDETVWRDEDHEILLKDISADSDDFARSSEEGWYYSDEAES